MTTDPKTEEEIGQKQLTKRGLQTRARILSGARRTFERIGVYSDTRITDIARESGVAYGSFYTYFASKEEVFQELAGLIVQEMYIEGTSRFRGDDPYQRIESSNRSFLAAYRERAKMMALIEQVAALYPEFRLLRRQLRQAFVERIEANIQRMVADGVARPRIDPRVAAHALVSMTDNFAYIWFVLGEPFDDDVALTTLTDLWAGALGVPGPAAHGS